MATGWNWEFLVTNLWWEDAPEGPSELVLILPGDPPAGSRHGRHPRPNTGVTLDPTRHHDDAVGHIRGVLIMTDKYSAGCSQQGPAGMLASLEMMMVMVKLLLKARVLPVGC